jgi:hypothetical protein
MSTSGHENENHRLVARMKSPATAWLECFGSRACVHRRGFPRCVAGLWLCRRLVVVGHIGLEMMADTVFGAATVIGASTELQAPADGASSRCRTGKPTNMSVAGVLVLLASSDVVQARTSIIPVTNGGCNPIHGPLVATAAPR